MNVLVLTVAVLSFAAAPPPATEWDREKAESTDPATPEGAAPVVPTAGDLATPDSAAPSTQVGGAPNLAPRFVATVADLAPLGSDPALRGQVATLERRRTGAVLCLVGAGVGATVAGLLALRELAASASAMVLDPACAGSTAGIVRCQYHADYTSALATLGVSAALTVAGAALMPRRSEIAEVVHLWNGRHPESVAETWPVVSETGSPSASPGASARR